MAIELNVWENDGPNCDVQIKRLRVKKVAEIPSLLLQLIERYEGKTVCITKDRTDGQSPYSHMLYKSSTYIELN